jgi:carbonic anhydrase
MKSLPEIFEKNKQWAQSVLKDNPDFFKKLENQQAPKYLWIGCSDSRVPANQICGLGPGEVFVHRNVANVVDHGDFNCLAVVQYAVEVLKVEHIIVCGHYGCGGVSAALTNQSYGLIDNWLMNIRNIVSKRKDEIDKIEDLKEKQNKLCELNVQEQVYNLCHSTIVQKAWRNGDKLSVHGWIYGLGDGQLIDLGLCIDSIEQLDEVYKVY